MINFWRRWLVSRGYTLSKHFISCQSYKDINVICDSFVCLLLYCHKNDLVFCPQYYSSDHCEQAFAYSRTGRYAGRRSNMSGYDLLKALERRNRSIEVEAETNVFTSAPLAHTRSRSMIGGEKNATYNNEPARVMTLQSRLLKQ